MYGPIVPDTLPLRTDILNTLTPSQSVTLTPGTKLLEVSAVNGGVYLRFDSTATTAVDNGFHAFIQSGMTRHYELKSGTTSITLLQRDSGAQAVVIEYP